MIQVDGDFLRRLAEKKVIATELIKTVLPERPWHEEKVATFLKKLSAQVQAKQTEAE